MKKTTWKRILAAALAALTFALLAAGCGIKKIDGTGTETGAVAQTPQQNPAGNEQPTSGVGGEPAGTAEPTDPQTEPQTEPAEPALDASFMPEDTSLDAEMLSDALAIALRGWEEGYIDDPNGLWAVVGYYAALRNRVSAEGEAGSWLSEQYAAYVAARLCPQNDQTVPIPEAWFSEGGGAARENRAFEKDGKTVLVPGYSFWGYDDMLASMLGVWREIASDAADCEGGTACRVTLTDHLAEGTRVSVFRFRFTVDEGGEWGLTDIVYPTDSLKALEDQDEERLAKALGFGLPGWSETALTDPDGIWGILAYYAALRNLEAGGEGSFLSEEEAEALQNVLRPGEGYVPMPDDWEENGIVKRVTVRSGDGGWIETEGYSFPTADYVLLMTLGQSVEISAERADGVDERAYHVTLTEHYDTGEDVYEFEFGFSKLVTENGREYWGLTSTTALYDDEIDYGDYDVIEGADFTMTDVREANRILNLLDRYGSAQVQVSGEGYIVDGLFLPRGDAVVERLTYTYFDSETGEASSFSGGTVLRDGRELSFSTFEGDIIASAWFDGDMAESEVDGYLQSFLGYGDAKLLSKNGDTVTFEVLDDFDPDSGNGYTCTLTADTLALLSYTIRVDGEEVSVTTTLGGEVEVPEVFSEFDRTRAVTVHLWGDGGWENAETKTWHVPCDWAFSVYFDNSEVELYDSKNLSEPVGWSIPASEADQEFWASAAKG